MTHSSHVKPITYLKNHTADLVRAVSEEGRSVLITQNGEAKVVVMDVASYERWRHALALLKILAHSEADVPAGRLRSSADALRRARKAIASVSTDG